MSFETVEDAIVEKLDSHAVIARTVAWGLAGVNALYGVMVLMNGNLVGGALGITTSLVLVWLLVKTRAKLPL